MRTPFTVRCFVKPTDGVWVAMCIDLGLSAQGESCKEAKAALYSQVSDYVHQALNVDREHAEELLNRKASLAFRIEYHWIAANQWLRELAHSQAPRQPVAFNELIPCA